MKRTISAMVGHGSVNHNSRKFHAKNTDPERSHLNVTYCQENIKAVYHELFDEALERYNAKQTRADRRIENYYEKIRSGKQEKPFHEIILQVGNKDDMSADSDEGRLAAAVLDEYTIVGIPMYADIFGTIPVAEALLSKGAQLGTVLSFMMAVTTLSLPSLIMLRKAVKPKLLALFIGICTIGIIIVGYLFNAFQFILI